MQYTRLFSYSFGWSAWLNRVYLGGDNGSSLLTTTTGVLSFPSSALNATTGRGQNVLTVLVHYHGHDETSTAKGVENPRGLLGAFLLPGGTANATGFARWKIQGNGGGSANIDPVRGPMNEGGLFAERRGYHLPGFDPSTTVGFVASDSPRTGLSTAGVRFYTTTFDLDLDSDLDVPLSVALLAPVGTVARVMLWVNGYQYGKFVSHIGPQTVFPVQNTLALSLWAQDGTGARLDDVNLVAYGVYQSDFGFARDWSALQPGWKDRRECA